MPLGQRCWSRRAVLCGRDSALPLRPSPPPALSLFLMAVNIKTPVVVENITLMCLRILQKLIKPPAPTSKKNKVLDRASPRPRLAPALPSPPLTWGEGTPSLPWPLVSRGGLGFLRRKASQRKVKRKLNMKIQMHRMK